MSSVNLHDETAARFIDSIVRNNQTETAAEIDTYQKKISRYKEKFGELGPRERNLKIMELALKNLQRLNQE